LGFIGFIKTSEFRYIHGISPVGAATTPEFIETFRICRVFHANHFGNKFVLARLYFHIDTGQILFCLFLQKKRKAFFSKNRW
jgi:hypothetical protein